MTPRSAGLSRTSYGKVTALGPDVIAGGPNFYQTGDASLVSKDRHVTIMPFAMAGTSEDASDNIDKVLNIVARRSSRRATTC